MKVINLCYLMLVTAVFIFAGPGEKLSFAEDEVIHLEDANEEIADDLIDTNDTKALSANSTAPNPVLNETNTTAAHTIKNEPPPSGNTAKTTANAKANASSKLKKSATNAKIKNETSNRNEARDKLHGKKK